MSLLGLCWGIRVTDTILARTISDIPGHIWIPWNALTLPPPRPLSPQSPLSSQLSVASGVAAAPDPQPSLSRLPSPGCVYFLSLFLAVFCRGRQFFLCPILRFVQLLTPALCVCSLNPEVILACSCLGACVTVLIRSCS